MEIVEDSMELELETGVLQGVIGAWQCRSLNNYQRCRVKRKIMRTMNWKPSLYGWACGDCGVGAYLVTMGISTKYLPTP